MLVAADFAASSLQPRRHGILDRVVDDRRVTRVRDAYRRRARIDDRVVRDVNPVHGRPAGFHERGRSRVHVNVDRRRQIYRH